MHWLVSTLIMVLLAGCASVLDQDPLPPRQQEPPTSWEQDPAPTPEETRPPRTNHPLDDPASSVPGTLEPQYDVIRKDPDNWLGIAPEDELLNMIRDPLAQLDEDHGIAISGAYTALFQQATKGPGDRRGAAGDLDIFLRWTPLGRGTLNSGSFFFAGEYRHEIGPTTPGDLGTDMGTLFGTTNGFNDRGWVLKEAYWVQQLFDDHFRFAIGRADTDGLVGAHKLQSANTSFLNKAFSANPTIATPGAGATAAASLRPTEWFYVAGGASNGYGNTTSSELDKLFEEWDLFSFAEAGFTPEIEGLGEGRFRVAIWHVDELDRTDRPSDQGYSIIIDQELGEDISTFFRYGHSHGDVTGVEDLLEAGGAWEGLIGSASDLTGFAAAVGTPEDSSLRKETVFEMFHRLQLSGRTQLTLGAQLILDPSSSPGDDAEGVFSLRFRVSF